MVTKIMDKLVERIETLNKIESFCKEKENICNPKERIWD